mgnify:CR=1 FL=1
MTNLHGLSTEVWFTLLESFVALVIGIALAAVASWKMALVCLGCLPLILIGGFVMLKVIQKFENHGGDPYKESNMLMADLLINYVTVKSLGDENINALVKKYKMLLTEP